MRFRILNKNPLYDYREACKITEGIDLWDDLEHVFKPKDEVEFWIKPKMILMKFFIQKMKWSFGLNR